MTQAEQFTIGARASCQDAERCGRLRWVVVDPVARAVTHLVVEPDHRAGLARLVPVELAEAGPGGLRLNCTLAEFERLDSAEETQFVPGSAGYAEYGPGQVLSWPYYNLSGGPAIASESEIGLAGVSHVATYDRVPLGEVEVRRGDPVEATDGAIGQVHGLVIDPADHHVTHFLLAEGHLWGRHQVAIPISAVTSVEDGINLSLSKQQVRDLPPVGVSEQG
jgi:sporulation protein YlmC with PRC-barrel domain